MTPLREATVKKLRKLAPTHTQAEAANILNVERQYVHQLANRYAIRFRGKTPAVPDARVCRKCQRRMIDGWTRCLRCKWTPERLRRLRKRYGLSQVAMAYQVMKMNVWAWARWENAGVAPSPRALLRLEEIEATS